MSAILTSIINLQLYSMTYYMHTVFPECHVNLTNFSNFLSQKNCIVHKPTPLYNVHWKHFWKCSLHILSYSTSTTRNCTHVHDGHYLQRKQTIHQSQHSAAFTHPEAILWIRGRWSPIIVSSIVSLFVPPPIWKSTSWPNRRTANTQWCPWKPFSWKVRLYFSWRINRRWPKWWSIMTIICWTLMKSAARKRQYIFVIIWME